MEISSMATRKAFGKGLMALANKYPNLVLLDADLSKSTMSNEFSRSEEHTSELQSH